MLPTLVINLDRDADRWRGLSESVTWPVTRLPAVDGRAAPGRPFHMNAMMYGCLMSHQRAWEIVAAAGVPHLVLEDDCDVTPGFEERALAAMATVPSTYGVAVLGYQAADVAGDRLLAAVAGPVMKRRIPRRVNADWLVPGVFFGSHCYAVSPAGARGLLRDPEMFHADAVMNRAVRVELYCVTKSLASQTLRSELMGRLKYNDAIGWPWLLAEPFLGAGPYTVRIAHLIAMYVLVAWATSRSRTVAIRAVGRAMIGIPVVHYFASAQRTERLLR